MSLTINLSFTQKQHIFPGRFLKTERYSTYSEYSIMWTLDIDEKEIFFNAFKTRLNDLLRVGAFLWQQMNAWGSQEVYYGQIFLHFQIVSL